MLLRVDLHVHTQESDGVLSVEEVVNLAYARDIRILAITDHESTEGIAKIESLAQSLNIQIIPGVELFTSFQGQEVHLLGYFKDANNTMLQDKLRELRGQRTALAHDMVEHLQLHGMSIKWEDVEREVGSEGAVTKGHIMRAIYHRECKLGQKAWIDISKLFLPGGVAYLPFQSHNFEDAVDLIFDCGGLPVIAHPGLLNDPTIVPKLLSYRPMGLEVYYAYWERQEELIPYFSEIAQKHAILATGGSDYHAPNGLFQLGHMDVPMGGVIKLQNYLLLS